MRQPSGRAGLAKEPVARFASGAELAGAVLRALATAATPPLELRAFLMESRHLSSAALLYGIVAGLAVPLLALSLVTAGAARNAIAAVVGIAWILALPAAFMYSRVRRLRLAGFRLHDLTDAIEAELGRRREELAFLYGTGPSRLERALRRTAYAAVSVAAAAVWLGVRPAGLVPAGMLPLGFGVAAGVALLAAVGARARTEHRTDPKVERRLRFWRGPLGRILFRIAGLGLGDQADAAEPAEPRSPDLTVGVVGSRFFERAENTT